MKPHGIPANTSDKPRIAQYIFMFPAQEQDEELKESHIEMWKELNLMSLERSYLGVNRGNKRFSLQNHGSFS